MWLYVSQGKNLTSGSVGWFPCQKVQPYISVSTPSVNCCIHTAWAFRKGKKHFTSILFWNIVSCFNLWHQNNHYWYLKVTNDSLVNIDSYITSVWSYLIPEANPRPVRLPLVSKSRNWAKWLTVQPQLASYSLSSSCNAGLSRTDWETPESWHRKKL